MHVKAACLVADHASCVTWGLINANSATEQLMAAALEYACSCTCTLGVHRQWNTGVALLLCCAAAATCAADAGACQLCYMGFDASWQGCVPWNAHKATASCTMAAAFAVATVAATLCPPCACRTHWQCQWERPLDKRCCGLYDAHNWQHQHGLKFV
jgi:hypothetical protein